MFQFLFVVEHNDEKLCTFVNSIFDTLGTQVLRLRAGNSKLLIASKVIANGLIIDFVFTSEMNVYPFLYVFWLKHKELWKWYENVIYPHLIRIKSNKK